MDIGNRHVCEAAVGGLHIFFVQLVTLNAVPGRQKRRQQRASHQIFAADVRVGSKADIALECALAGGQVSCGDFDSVPGVVILELCWA